MINKDEILELEKQGNFVFHGSVEKLDYLEPRQAYTWKENIKTKDGEPAVFASKYSDIAIFMALINMTNLKCTFHSGFGMKNDKLEFRLSKELSNKLVNLRGYLYIFNKSDFIQKNGLEYISYKTVKPVKILEINESVLPNNINYI